MFQGLQEPGNHTCSSRSRKLRLVWARLRNPFSDRFSLSRAREAMQVYTRNKLELRQSVMQPGERKSVWELLQALQRSKPQPGDRKMPDLWAARQAKIVREVGMER